jgi:hypothetical protein
MVEFGRFGILRGSAIRLGGRAFDVLMRRIKTSGAGSATTSF